ncbi:hypothetical protein BDZ94DRAFT_1174571 [Collybia nuda]|uniref:Uncharacterized protein n=1 Tax=Collybia nuda TaxID=64659 RepID=A0A9P6CA65_9AGAR|nr:hypothetical protein BDZ94DRAFT_1174571 [Collybia nuda]
MTPSQVREINNAYFNACNFYSLMQAGIHFGVLWIALVNIFTTKKRRRASRRVLALLAIVMFVLSSVDYGNFWAYVHRGFIEHGDTSQSTASSLGGYPNWFIGLSIASDANALIADSITVKKKNHRVNIFVFQR